MSRKEKPREEPEEKDKETAEVSPLSKEGIDRIAKDIVDGIKKKDT